MKTSQLFTICMLIIAATSQVGCSAKIEAKGDPGPGPLGPPPGGFDTRSLTGVWKSGCHLEFPGISTDSQVTINEGNYSWLTKQFQSDNCAEGTLQESKESTGRFEVKTQSTMEPGSYYLNIIETEKDGVTITLFDLVRFEADKLYFGDRSVVLDGNYPSAVDRKRAFRK